MCYKVSFISHYNTLWHYYTLLFFLLFFLLWHIGLLFFLLFFLLWHIIFHYFSYYFQLWQGVCTLKWECADSNSWPIHQGMAHLCRWRMPVQLPQLEGALKEWKVAWWSVPVLLYALFLLLYALFFTSDKDCSCCKYVLRTADLCTTFLCVTPSLGNSREAAIAVWSA